MKVFKNINLVMLILVLFTSCEKVIDVDLKESEPKIVIEAVLQEGNNNFIVSISKTAPYFDNQQPELINNASVKLTGGLYNTHQIPNIGDGVYSTQVNASSNTEYSLQVTVDGVEYNATSYLNKKIAIDTIYSLYETGFGPHISGYSVYFKYFDPANESNYYRVTHSVNGEYDAYADGIQVFNDKSNDGNEIQFPLMMESFEVGDTVSVSLIHYDKASYDYFSSLADIIGGGGGPSSGSAAPGNPISNWSNNALGYFSAYSKYVATVVVTEEEVIL